MTIDVNGNTGIGTSTQQQRLVVAGTARVTGALYDGVNNSAGTAGMVLQTTGSGTQWVATSTLGITGGSGVSGGTNGFVARFTSATALSTGLFLDNGTVAGVNATSSGTSFWIQGTAGNNNPLVIASSTGTQLLTVLPNGNVGIGTTTPDHLLYMYGANTAKFTYGISGFGERSVGIGDDLNGYGVKITDTAASNPSVKFVSGTTGSADARNFILIPNYDNWGDFAIRQSTSNSTDPYTTGTTRFVLNKNGNVGIGTATPISKLTVAGSGIFGTGEVINPTWGADVSDIIAGTGNNVSGYQSAVFGSSNTLGANSANSFMAGTGNTITSSLGGVVTIGTANYISASNSYALGGWNTLSNGNNYVLGSYVNTTANDAIYLGEGVNNSSRVTNNVANSIMMGMNSTNPTLVINGGYTTSSTGSVSIGTSTNTSLLTVQNIATTTLPILTVASSSGASMVTIGALGNVGIGTSTAPNALYVQSDNDVVVARTCNGCGGGYMIGTLRVRQSGATPTTVSATGTGATMVFDLVDAGGTIINSVAGIGAYWVNNAAGIRQANLAFNTYAPGGAQSTNAAMTLQYDGTFGIGTTTPVAQITAKGTDLIVASQYSNTSYSGGGAMYTGSGGYQYGNNLGSGGGYTGGSTQNGGRAASVFIGGAGGSTYGGGGAGIVAIGGSVAAGGYGRGGAGIYAKAGTNGTVGQTIDISAPAAYLDGNGQNALLAMNGNVGIGVTAPAAKFESGTSGGDVASAIFDSSNSFVQILSSNCTRGGLQFNQGGNLWTIAQGNTGCGDTRLSFSPGSYYATPTLTLNGANVGIGTITPTTRLEVVDNTTTGPQAKFYGGDSVYNNSNVEGEIQLGQCLGAYYYGRLQYHYGGNALNLDSVNGDLALRTGSAGTSDRLHVMNSGNIGINTTSPTSLLVLQGTGATLPILTIASSTGNTMLQITPFGAFVQNIASTTAFVLKDGSTTPSTVFAVDTTQASANSGLDITAGAAQTGNLLNFFSSGGTQMLAVTANGGILQNISSTNAMQIQNGSGVNVFSVNTASGVVNIATSASTSIVSMMAADGNMTIGDDGLTGTTDGRIWLRSRGTTFRFNSTGNTADYSEFFYKLSTSTPEIGTVISQDNSTTSPVNDAGLVKVASSSYDSNIIGIVTTRGTGFNNPNDDRQFKANFVNVGMLGHLLVKISLENGPIQPGDYLTSSSLHPGYAMKATRSGKVIGTALNSFDGNVYAATTTTQSTPMGTMPVTVQIFVGTTSTGTVLTLVKPDYQIINNTFVLGENDGQLATATSTATSTQNSFLIDQKGSGNILQLQSNDQNRLLVSNDGSMSILANSTSSTENILTVTNGSSTLFTINSVGDAQFIGHIIVGKDTAGTATIKAGDNQTTITFVAPYASVPKVVATVNGVPTFFYGVINKTATGFTISTNQAMTQDTTFDWVALAQPVDVVSVSSQNLSVIGSPSSPPPPITPPSTGTSTPPTDASSTPPDSGGTVAGTSTPPSTSDTSTTTPPLSDAGSGTGSTTP